MRHLLAVPPKHVQQDSVVNCVQVLVVVPAKGSCGPVQQGFDYLGLEQPNYDPLPHLGSVVDFRDVFFVSDLGKSDARVDRGANV